MDGIGPDGKLMGRWKLGFQHEPLTLTADGRLFAQIYDKGSKKHQLLNIRSIHSLPERQHDTGSPSAAVVPCWSSRNQSGFPGYGERRSVFRTVRPSRGFITRTHQIAFSRCNCPSPRWTNGPNRK